MLINVFKNLKQIELDITQYWQDVIDRLVQSLKDVGRYASGNTAQEIANAKNGLFTVLSQGRYEVRLSMPSYYKFIDEGVKGSPFAVRNPKSTIKAFLEGRSRSSVQRPARTTGRYGYGKKMPPIRAIRRFMQNREIVGKQFEDASKIRNKARKQRTIDQILNNIAYAIAYKIWRDGLDRTDFYSNVVNEAEINKFAEFLLNKYAEQYIIEITELT